MLRTIALSVAAGFIGAAALAGTADRQLAAPNLNPGLKTVPSIPEPQSAAAGFCSLELVNRIDAGSIVEGPDGPVAHFKGIAAVLSGAEAQLVITSVSPDGETANADFLACSSAFVVGRPARVSASMGFPRGTKLRSITVRAQTNSLVLSPSSYK
jgi:hypothetical protein